MEETRKLAGIILTDDDAFNDRFHRLATHNPIYEFSLVSFNQYADFFAAIKNSYWDLMVIDYEALPEEKLLSLQALQQINLLLPTLILVDPKDPTRELEFVIKGIGECLDKRKFSTVEIVRAVHHTLEKNNLLQQNAQLQRLAHFDVVTGLPNRLQFEKTIQNTLSQAKRHHRQFALLSIDVDDFKEINDSLGHGLGDLLLKEIGQRFQQCMRNEDLVARVGGDEFAVMPIDIKDYRDAGKIASKLLDIMQSGFNFEKRDIHVGISIGIACFPLAGEEMSILLKNADIALYQAKRKGKNNYEYFSQITSQFTNEFVQY